MQNKVAYIGGQIGGPGLRAQLGGHLDRHFGGDGLDVVALQDSAGHHLRRDPQFAEGQLLDGAVGLHVLAPEDDDDHAELVSLIALFPDGPQVVGGPIRLHAHPNISELVIKGL